MGAYHVVRQGEHLSRIARRYGFSDYRTIWNHPENAALKAERQNPNVIFPEDSVFIPDKEVKEESRPTDQRHRFRVRRPDLKLRIVLEDLYERPIAKAPCLLTVDGETRPLTTDGRGHFEQPITLDAEDAVLVVRDKQTPANELPITVKIGHLDPVDKLSGQKGRLHNLGYFYGSRTGSAAQDPDEFQSAVEEFQCDHGLTVDGKCGPVTQAKLKQVHGC